LLPTHSRGLPLSPPNSQVRNEVGRLGQEQLVSVKKEIIFQLEIFLKLFSGILIFIMGLFIDIGEAHKLKPSLPFL
jgi:hypothetical protein